MTRRLLKWAIAERDFLRQEIAGFRAGATLRAPGGEDITARKIDELVIRLERATILAEELENDGRS